MSTVLRSRPRARVMLAGAIGGLALLAAACGAPADPGGGTAPGPTADQAAYNERGPITYVQGKDTSGFLQKQIDKWNEANPDQEVTLVELPEDADSQRAQFVQNAQTRNPDYTVLGLDVVWTAEFAANSWVDPLPSDQLDLTDFVQGGVQTSTYFDQLYAVPLTANGALLYYRKDLLDAAGVTKVPTTYAEMKQACETVKSKVAEAKDIDCYSGQHQKYEGLTVNISEAVNSSGGSMTDEQGKPAVNTPEAKQAFQWLADWFADGTIPKEALTWKEEESRTAFQDGKLIFMRNWPYAYALANKGDGSSKVNGKFDIAPLPGLNGPGTSTLGGRNLAISAFAKNKGTALEFVKYMTQPEQQKEMALQTSQAPILTSLYDDAELNKTYGYYPVLLESLKSAKQRPQVVRYGDVTLAIQDAVYPVEQGTSQPDAAADQLQTRLSELTG
ncbi:multiple sugar transport system substrate-binding protein [Naumannella cuiyingiana]|uniref:Multiple sugar transport system substrate-binding protein n=1 Tax=Naumannella cuiyingiana TaxID=1347891 RepID=A0A7Z0D780_9ACTN|nr:ABC transporter substrate-binding protein [Naumannella cuiyingiana]NYI70154.1 multiple sugar transport system substrate-binding protein [Naumannella cuiyingiana]